MAAENNKKTEKKLLNKFEWYLFAFALAILVMVILQNMGINMIETTEKVEITEAERKAQEAAQRQQTEANTFYEKKSQARND